MEAVPQDVFLSAAAARGIGIDPAYQEDWPRNLAFVGGPSHRRYWDFSADPSGFLRCLLGAVRWRSIEVWPKVEDWGSDLEAAIQPELPSLLRFVASSIGEPLGTDGAIRFAREDADVLYALLIGLASEGWSWTEDAYLLPDDDDVILQFDHHGVVHAEFRSEERLTEFVGHLEAEGFPLPTEPPDGTFKAVEWQMGGEGDDPRM